MRGVCRQVSEANRLLDVLSSRDEILLLRDVEIATHEGVVIGEAPEIRLEKRWVLLAYPKETEEFRARQRLYRAGMSRPALVGLAVLVLAPPFAVRGTMHVRPGTSFAYTERATMARFFPLTGARVDLGVRNLIEADVALVNRDLVALIVPEQQAALEQVSLGSRWSATEAADFAG